MGGEGWGDGCQREWEEAEETAIEEDHPTPLSRTAPKRIFFFLLPSLPRMRKQAAASDCSGSSIFRSFQTKPQLSSLFFLQRKRITTSMEKRSKKRQEGGKHNLPPPLHVSISRLDPTRRSNNFENWPRPLLTPLSFPI